MFKNKNSKNDGDRILLSRVRSLTLRNGQMTRGRRVKPVPQVKCVGGDAKGLYEVDVVRCTNMGSDYGDEDVNWACTADVPKYFKFGSTDVICEGYENADDKYVLKGSCGVEYRLALTDAGYKKYGDSMLRNGKDIGTAVFWVFFVGILAWIVYSVLYGVSARPQGGRSGNSSGSGGGGGGSGPGNDPPPPYDYPSSSRKYTYRPSSATQQQSPSSSSSTEGWRPGFWSGLATGVAGSYLANRNQDNTTRHSAGRYGTGSGADSGGEGSRFGGWESSSSSGTRRSDDNSGFPSGSHSTTGFGQTRRR